MRQHLAATLATSIAIGAGSASAQQPAPPQQVYPAAPPQVYPSAPPQVYPPAAPSPAQVYPPPAYAYPPPGYQGAYPPPAYQGAYPPAGYQGAYAAPAYQGVYGQPGYAPVQPGAGAVPRDQAQGRLGPGEHRFSLLVSALHPIVFGIYDATAEFRLGRQGGLAIIGGVGSASLQQFSRSLPDESARVYEGGLQLRLYPVGTFDHGMQIGTEIVYLTGSASATGTMTAGDPPVTYTGAFTAKGSGFKVGAFVGYKLALPVGLTLAAQIGVDYLSLKAIAKDADGHSKTGDTKTAFLLADAGVGWSF